MNWWRTNTSTKMMITCQEAPMLYIDEVLYVEQIAMFAELVQSKSTSKCWKRVLNRGEEFMQRWQLHGTLANRCSIKYIEASNKFCVSWSLQSCKTRYEQNSVVLWWNKHKLTPMAVYSKDPCHFVPFLILKVVRKY